MIFPCEQQSFTRCFVRLLTTLRVMRQELTAQHTDQPCPCGRLEMSYSDP